MVHGGAGAGDDVLKDLARDAGQGYRPVVKDVLRLRMTYLGHPVL